MLTKLALRNVKRQMGNYLIYFITVSLTVALMFSVNNVIFSKELRSFAGTFQDFNLALVLLMCFIALIVAIVLGYATSFMLRLRKREFGTYLTLGMTRKNLLSIFLLENLALCGAALGAGILMGVFIFQGLMAVVSGLLELPVAFASYSTGGLLLTIGLVCAIFLLASATSAAYLKKARIYDLIHGAKKVEVQGKYPVIWFTGALLCLAGLLGSGLYLKQSILLSFTNDLTAGKKMMCSIAVLCLIIILLHICLARGLVGVLLRRKRLCSRGTNTFTLRQLSAQLSANAIIAGLLAFLMAFAIIAANLSFVQKISSRLTLENGYPFDVTAIMDANSKDAIALPQGLDIIREYAEIQSVTPYHVYTSGRGDLHGATRWSGDGYSGLLDSFMPLSEYNQLMKKLGRSTAELHGEYLICGGDNTTELKNEDFSGITLSLNQKAYRYKGTQTGLPQLTWAYFFAVVPDEAVRGMAVESACAAIDLKSGDYDVKALEQALTYQFTPEGVDYPVFRTDYKLRESGRMQINSITAIVVVGALYLSVVFVFMAMAVLALKTLAGLSEDKERFNILFRLGVGRKGQAKALFRQTFCFFFLPFAVPLLLSIPTAYFSSLIMTKGGYGFSTGEIYTTAGLIALVMSAVYILYFTATYLIAKRAVLTRR